MLRSTSETSSVSTTNWAMLSYPGSALSKSDAFAVSVILPRTRHTGVKVTCCHRGNGDNRRLPVHPLFGAPPSYCEEWEDRIEAPAISPPAVSPR